MLSLSHSDRAALEAISLASGLPASRPLVTQNTLQLQDQFLLQPKGSHARLVTARVRRPEIHRLLRLCPFGTLVAQLSNPQEFRYGRKLAVTWEMALFRRAGLAEHKSSLQLFEAYTKSAPLWERTLLAAYVGLGPPIARLFGGNTKTVWQHAETIIGDLFAVSDLGPQAIVAALRHYIQLKRKIDHHLPFEHACELIYDQSFYPLVTHFTFAFQSSAIARMRFVQRIAAAMAFRSATVADLGCGSGAMLCNVLESKTGWSGYGLDISSESVSYARRLAIYKGVANRGHFQRGTIADLPMRDRSVDLVIASEVIEHLPDLNKAFSEIARVLAPGGFLALTVPIESHTPAHLNSLSTDWQLYELCHRAGLKVQTLKSKWHLTFGDDRRHLFAVAQLGIKKEVASGRHYSFAPPQMSSAASNGIVSS